MNFTKDLMHGMKRGLPICLGYIPVSFTFGLMVVEAGLSPWLAILISLTNLTSAGQFAGLGIIVQDGSWVELGVTTLVINLRYMLMSLSLSQKIDPAMSVIKRALISYGVTDEIFAVASTEAQKVTFPYMCGLIALPVIGWTSGTAMGAVISSALPKDIQSAMGITLYAMFIAIVVPVAKASKQVAIVVLISAAINAIFTWGHLFDFISGGWQLIIASSLAASIGAFLFPVKGAEYE